MLDGWMGQFAQIWGLFLMLISWIEIIDTRLGVIGYVYNIYMFCVDTWIDIRVQHKEITMKFDQHGSI
jgi:hypothetical protein